MRWPFFRRSGRQRSPFNNLGPKGLTCGKVTEHLYVGGELGPHDWNALENIGVSVVINLQEEQQDVFHSSERVDGYLWLPAPDQYAPTVQQLKMGTDFIQAAVEEGKRVFVHCKAGRGRAPLLCACYLVSLGDTAEQAMKKVNKSRPSTTMTLPQTVQLHEFAAVYGPAEADGQDETHEQEAVDGQEVIVSQEADVDREAARAQENGHPQAETLATNSLTPSRNGAATGHHDAAEDSEEVAEHETAMDAEPEQEWHSAGRWSG